MRFDYLDSMRGQAALAVVWVHFFGVFGLGYFRAIDKTPLHVFWNGSAAVAFFFVLSGFVLSIRSFQRPDERNSLPGFYAARAIRICMPYSGILIISKLCHDHLRRDFVTMPPMSRWATNLWRPAEGSSWLETLAGVPLITPGTEHEFVPQAWTLTIELQLAILIPAFVLVAKRSSVWLVALTAILYWLFDLPVFAANFVFGVLIAKHHAEVERFVSALSRAAYIACGVVAIYLYNFKVWPKDYKAVAFKAASDGLWLVIAVGAAMLLAMILGRPSVQRVLMAAPLRFLGRISYSLYLVHLLVLIQFVPLLLVWINEAGIRGTNALALLFPSATAICLAFAYAFHRCVEEPFHALARLASRGRWGLDSRAGVRARFAELMPFAALRLRRGE